MLALYGLQSRTACSPTSTLVPNYAEAWMHLEIFEETLRAKQNDFGNFPRLTATTRWLQFWPTRFCPKSIVHQIKDNGKEKDRPVTDAGARRTKGRRDRLENVHRSNVSKSKVRNLIGAARDLQKSSTAKSNTAKSNTSEIAICPFLIGFQTRLITSPDLFWYRMQTYKIRWVPSQSLNTPAI